MTLTTLSPRPGSVAFGRCTVEWTGEELALANTRIERRWRVANGLLYPLSLKDRASGREWLARPAEQPAPCPEVPLPEEPRAIRVMAGHGVFGPTEAPALRVEVVSTGPTLALCTCLQLFDDAPGIQVQLHAEPVEAPAGEARSGTASGEDAAPTGIEGPAHEAGTPAGPVDLLEQLALSPAHLRLTQVTLLDQTDIRNELLFESEWLLHPNELRLELSGNLFAIEELFSGDGLLFLKQAPLPHARPVQAGPDLRVNGASRVFHFLGHGAGPGGGQGYPYVILVYRGGASGRTEALQAYQRQIRAFNPARDGLLLSNTWGDRSQDSRVCEEFMRQEVNAAASLGVDVIQIDDGWQKGRTSNSAQAGGVWGGFWAADPEFWAPHAERFPNGLEPIIAEARERGMQFGLWYAPDPADDYANWERDAARVLELHRAHGIRTFKIDGVRMESKAAETNLRRFFDRVLQETRGEVVFDLDVTAAVRPGYWGMMHVGPLFIENRYTEWRRYWPHQTLRNLWKLARYVDPLRLRMEFLNHTRNTHLYGDDPLAPASYSPAYLFAITLFANPLGWFEVSNLPAAYVEEVAELVKVWKAHRERLFQGYIHPIGETPDGTSWTGFLSVGEDRHEGYLILFREVNDRPSYSLALPMLQAGEYAVECLAGQGSAVVHAGRVEAEIPNARGFLFARLYQ